jgi:hypothetical protein
MSTPEPADLVAPVESTREVWTGASFADSFQGVVAAIQNGDWVQGAFSGVGLGFEAVSSAIDPLGALLANGLGWAMEYFAPLREMLDEVTGIPDVARAHAATWNNMAAELDAMATDLGARLGGDLPDWTGNTPAAYQELMANNVDAIGGLSATSAAMGAATEGAAGLVELTREIVRDLIADLVAKIVSWAVQALTVVAIPKIAVEIVIKVAEWGSRILEFLDLLITSLTNLTALLNG